MENKSPKIVLILNSHGLESVTVHASDPESRQSGYNTCVALESTFAEVERIIRGLNETRDMEIVKQ